VQVKDIGDFDLDGFGKGICFLLDRHRFRFEVPGNQSSCIRFEKRC
jgi:hypothetical protein